MHADAAAILARHNVTVAQFQAPSGRVTDTVRRLRTRALRDLVRELGSALAVAEALSMPHSTITSRCERAGIVLAPGASVVSAAMRARAERDPNVPGLLEGRGEREDCVREAACLGALVARNPNALGARCRPGCAQRLKPDPDERRHLAMVGAIGCSAPVRRSA
jgi:hypothetical protein